MSTRRTGSRTAAGLGVVTALFLLLSVLTVGQASAGEGPVPDEGLRDGACSSDVGPAGSGGLKDPDCWHLETTTRDRAACEDVAISQDRSLPEDTRRNPATFDEQQRRYWKGTLMTGLIFRCDPSRTAAGATDLVIYLADENCPSTTKRRDCPTFQPPDVEVPYPPR